MKVTLDTGAEIEIIDVPHTIDDVDSISENFYNWAEKNKHIWRPIEGGSCWGIKTIIYYLEHFVFSTKEKIEIIDEPVNNNRVKYNDYPVWNF